LARDTVMLTRKNRAPTDSRDPARRVVERPHLCRLCRMAVFRTCRLCSLYRGR
jgi:hypothetical protein